MAKCLVQVGFGEHERLLDAIADHHSWYCRLHGFDYFPKKDNAAHPLPPSWARIPLLIDLLGRYETVVWMDVDAVVCDPFLDIGSACPFGIGAARYDLPFPHHQCGVLVCKASRQVLDVLMKVLEVGKKNDYSVPGKYGMWEQHPLNEIGIEDGVISSISVKWNFVAAHAKCERPAVVAAHGHPFDQRLALVSDWANHWKSRRFSWPSA